MTPEVSAPSSAPTRTLPPQDHVDQQLRPHPGVTTVLVGILLALGVAAIAVLYRLSPYPSDQLNYFDAAREFPHRSSTGGGEHQLLRIGLIVPLRLAQMLFGYSQGAYLLVPTLAAIGLAVAVYALGVLLFNRTVGFAAAVLTVGNSIVFTDLTAPLPDLLATALLCSAVALTLAIRQGRHVVTASARRQAGALVMVGILLGWSYLTREYIVFCWPLVPFLLWKRLPYRRLLWIVAPLTAIGLVELGLNAAASGDALARLHASASHGQSPTSTSFIGHSRQWYLSRPAAILGGTPEGTWLKAALLATVAAPLISRRLAFLAGWAAIFALPLIALGGFLDPDHPMLRITKERYWIPLMPAVCLCAVAGVWLLARNRATVVPALRGRSRVVATWVTLAVVAVPVGIAQHARMTEPTPQNASFAANGGVQLEHLRPWLDQHSTGVTTVWAEPRTYRLVKLFATGTFGGPVWSGELKLWLPGASHPQPLPGDYVVLYSPRSGVCGPCRDNAEALLGSPVHVPASWQPAFISSRRVVEIYQVR
ncbi:hypothetical protein ABN034_01795 [Actinopolymorpha sp. B11F2]|uniref:ArnT family glycosyltransferase n=1 Tax=Actinopolymorpha sp. B11F2 TaxID=3160862 RepID=UPI0032E3CEA6